MTERGLSVDHSTIFRWVQRCAPELNRHCRSCLKQTNDSWRVDETYVKVRGKSMYLYQAVDSTGQTLDFLLNETRSTRAAKRFFRNGLDRPNITVPRVINVDKNPAYIGAVRDLRQEKQLPEYCKRRAKSVYEQHDGAGSPVHEAQNRARIGLWIVSNCLAYDSGIRNDAHDMEETNRGNCQGKHQGHRIDFSRSCSVWSRNPEPTGLNRRAHQTVARILCNTGHHPTIKAPVHTPRGDRRWRLLRPSSRQGHCSTDVLQVQNESWPSGSSAVWSFRGILTSRLKPAILT